MLRCHVRLFRITPIVLLSSTVLKLGIPCAQNIPNEPAAVRQAARNFPHTHPAFLRRANTQNASRSFAAKVTNGNGKTLLLCCMCFMRRLRKRQGDWTQLTCNTYLSIREARLNLKRICMHKSGKRFVRIASAAFGYWLWLRSRLMDVYDISGIFSGVWAVRWQGVNGLMA